MIYGPLATDRYPFISYITTLLVGVGSYIIVIDELCKTNSMSNGVISVCSAGVIFVRLQHPLHIFTSFRNGSGYDFERSNVPRSIVANKE